MPANGGLIDQRRDVSKEEQKKVADKFLKQAINLKTETFKKKKLRAKDDPLGLTEALYLEN